MTNGGFKTKWWGKYVWRLIHLIPLNIPTEGASKQRQEDIKYFFVALSKVLPCRACRDEFQKLLRSKTLGINRKAWFATRESGFRYTVKLHATVNKRLRKPYTNDFRHWRKHYEKMRSS